MKDQRHGAVFDTFYRERRVAAAIDATPIARKEKIDLCRPGSVRANLRFTLRLRLFDISNAGEQG
jgi:hypothetical protein